MAHRVHMHVDKHSVNAANMKTQGRKIFVIAFMCAEKGDNNILQIVHSYSPLLAISIYATSISR